MTKEFNPKEARALVERLKAFADGCRGSMWQSRDETITLLDQSAETITAALEEIERLREALAVISKSTGQGSEYTICYSCADSCKTAYEALKGT